jgi:uncharacterized phiE125 gp8 family phage protein
VTVTLAQVKNYLRYETSETDQDVALGIILAGAQNWVEKHTGHALTQREFVQPVYAFTDYIDLQYFPYASGVSIAYRDTAGDAQEIDDAVVIDAGGVSRVYPASTWPSTATAPGIAITYTAGYADPDDAPEVMLLAMCVIVAMTDEERGALSNEGKSAAHWLLESYHKPALA